MASKRRRCKRCKRQFTPLAGAGRRVNCYECRPARGDASVLQFPHAKRDDEQPEQTVVDLSKGVLRAAGRLNTWQGMAAVRVAERIDASSHTMAQDVKALEHLMSVALAGVKAEEPDEVDNVYSLEPS